MITKTYNLDMHPGGVPLVIHLSQYDKDFSLVFNLYSSVGTFTVESSTTATIRGTKASGTGYSVDATLDVSNQKVTVTGDQQMTAAAGKNIFELTLTKSGKELNTANFIIEVERAALDGDTITDASVLRELEAITESAEIATAAAAEAEQSAESVADLADTFATSISQIMTNTDDISDIKAHLSTLIFTEDFKEALLACFEKVAWIDGSGEELYTALQNALEAKEIISIGVVFNQGSAVINPSTSLDTLKNYLAVTANYSDGTTETVTAYTLSGTLTLGTSTILVSYLGRTALFTCTVTAATLASITCSFTQSGAVYSTDSLDSLKSGLVVTAVYSDSTTQNVPSADCTLSGTLSVGTSTITVTYQGKSATFTVTVSPPVELSSITAVFTQGQNVIYDDDTLDDLKPYLVVTAAYTDSSTRTVSDYTLSGTLEIGTSTITVTYQGETDDFDVTVVSGVQITAISDSWDVILSGVNKYHIGNYKSLDLGSQGTVEMQIVAKGKDAKSDNSGNAKYTWISRGLLNTERRMNPAKVANTSGTGTLGGWEASEMRAFLKSTVLPLIPPGIRSAIVPVNKYTRIYQASDETAVTNVVTSEDVWIPSTREIFINNNYESEGPTYDPLYADDGESNIKYLNGTATRYWARTAQSETNFRGVNLTAGNAGWAASEVRGIALGFCTDSVTLPATRIEAVFDPGANHIYTDNTLDSLKQYLTVTYYHDGTSEVLSGTDYTLSGSVTAGTQTFTATYSGLTDTFSVTVFDFYNMTSRKKTDGSLIVPQGNFQYADSTWSEGNLYPSRIVISGPHRSNHYQRRTLAVDRGRAPMYLWPETGATQAIPTSYYPVPVPSAASGYTLVLPTGYNMWVNELIYDSSTGEYTEAASSGAWVSGTYTRTLSNNPGNLFVTGSITGNETPLPEPSEVTITFA